MPATKASVSGDAARAPAPAAGTRWRSAVRRMDAPDRSCRRPGLLTADDLADQLSRTQLQVASCVLGFGQVSRHGHFGRNHRAGRAERTLGQFQWLATVQEPGYRVCEQSIRQNEVTADLQW